MIVFSRNNNQATCRTEVVQQQRRTPTPLRNRKCDKTTQQNIKWCPSRWRAFTRTRHQRQVSRRVNVLCCALNCTPSPGTYLKSHNNTRMDIIVIRLLPNKYQNECVRECASACASACCVPNNLGIGHHTWPAPPRVSLRHARSAASCTSTQYLYNRM